jgi:hypothetical protein
MRRPGRRILPRVVALRATAVLSAIFMFVGCQSAYFLTNNPTRKVSPEYDRLAEKMVAIVVWADPVTLDEDFAARFRVADAVRYHLQRGLPKLKLVDIREITEFQESSGLDWESMSNAAIGKRFKAGAVLRIDLLEYTTRARDSQAVRKGRIRASVSVYEVDRPDNRPAYTTQITAVWPQEKRTDVLNRSDLDILNNTLAVLGEQLARKFHEHEVAY